MLELDQILRANEINFAILAALPAFFLSIVMLTVLRTWLKKVRIVIIQGKPNVTEIHIFDPFFYSFVIFIQFDFTDMKQDSKAQGRGRIARIHRRLLVVEIEKRIMQYQSYIEQGRVRCPLFSFSPFILNHYYFANGSCKKSCEKISGRFLMLLQDKDAETVFGLLIYSLERLYRVVEKPARATDEWDL